MQAWSLTTIVRRSSSFWNASAITEFVNLSKPQVALHPVLAPVNSTGSAAGLSAIQPNTSTDIQIVQENIQFSTQSWEHGIISGGSFANCSFNFHFKWTSKTLIE